MSLPDGPRVPVPEPVQTASKAVVSAVTTGLSVIALFATQISDGALTWAEGGTLIAAVAGAVATIVAVFHTPNKPKG